MRNDFVLMSLISAEEHILQIFLTQDKIPTGINIFCPLDKWFPQLVYESKLRRFVRWIDMGDTYIKPENNVWNWKTWNIGGFLVEYVENLILNSILLFEKCGNWRVLVNSYRVGKKNQMHELVQKIWLRSWRQYCENNK